MIQETVTVTVDGEPCPYIEMVAVSLSAERGVRSAQIGLSEPDGRFWMPPGSAVTITAGPAGAMAGGSTVLTGYVRDYIPGVRKSAGREVSVNVESKTADVAEGGVVHKTGRVAKKTLDKAASEFGQGYSSKFKVEGGALEPIPEIVYWPGETLFSLVERYARSQGLFVTDDEQGDQVLFKGTRGRHAGVLSYPGTIKDARAKLSERNRASETRVRGQGARGWSRKTLRAEARIKDPGIRRHRPRIVIHEGDADPTRLMERARYDQMRAAGGSVTATVAVAGWRDEGGRIWTPGFVVALDAWEGLRIARDMAVASAQLSWSKDKGTEATLELRDPKSFSDGKKAGRGGKGSKGSGSSKAGSLGAGRADEAWDVPDDEASLTVDE